MKAEASVALSSLEPTHARHGKGRRDTEGTGGLRAGTSHLSIVPALPRPCSPLPPLPVPGGGAAPGGGRTLLGFPVEL